jgi:hypothetical protein
VAGGDAAAAGDEVHAGGGTAAAAGKRCAADEISAAVGDAAEREETGIGKMSMGSNKSGAGVVDGCVGVSGA